MKKTIYQFNTGTEEVPVLVEKSIACADNRLEANLAIAKEEAYNGEYEIFDDGQPEPEVPSGDGSVWDELDNAYQSGYDEGYEEGVNTAYDE